MALGKSTEFVEKFTKSARSQVSELSPVFPRAYNARSAAGPADTLKNTGRAAEVFPEKPLSRVPGGDFQVDRCLSIYVSSNGRRK